jgi:RsiW-degrading membrane proteinase PrsW (M82 family)
VAVANARAPLLDAKKEPATSYAVRDALSLARLVIGAALLATAGAWPYYLHHLRLLFGLVLITFPARAVRFRTIYNFFLIGLFVSVVTIGVQFLVERELLGGRHPVLGGVVIAPLTEEPLKLLPLVIALLVPRWGLRHAHGACDLMLCAAALGSGFGYTEDFLYHTRFPRAGGPHILGVAVFPDAFKAFIGHGGATAFIGLTLGYLVYAASSRKLFTAAVAATGFVTMWMLVDHGLANYQVHVAASRWLFPIRWIWTLGGMGTLAPYVLLALTLITALAEGGLVWWITRKLPRVSVASWIRYIGAPLRQGIGYAAVRRAAMRVRARFEELLVRRELAYLDLHARAAPSQTRPVLASLAARRAGRWMLLREAVGRAVHPGPKPAAR